MKVPVRSSERKAAAEHDSAAAPGRRPPTVEDRPGPSGPRIEADPVRVTASRGRRARRRGGGRRDRRGGDGRRAGADLTDLRPPDRRRPGARRRAISRRSAAGAILADMALTAERDEYLGALQRLQAEFANYRKRVQRQQEEQSARAAADLVVKLLPVVDALDLAEAHLHPGDGAASAEATALIQARALLVDVLAREGLERVDEAERPLRPDHPRRRRPYADGRPAARPTGPRVRRRRPRRCGDQATMVDGVLRPGTGGGTRCCARPWSASGVSHGARSASGSRRTTTRCSEWRRRPPTRRSPAPTGSWPSSTTPTPTRAPRSVSRRSRPPTTCWATPRSARSTTRCGGWARWPAASAVRPAGAVAPGHSGWRTWATSATCSGGSSGAAGPVTAGSGPAAGCRRRGRAAPVLRGRRAGGHHIGPRPRGRALPHLLGHGAAPGTRPTPVPGARAKACSRTTRACSPSRRSAPVQRPGHRGRHPLPDVPRHRAGAAHPAGQGAHPGRGGGRSAHPGQGPGRARARARAPGRPLRGGPGGQALAVRSSGPEPDPDRARRPSPRRPWAPRSPCPPWTTR